jgi:hypothetical protein
MEQQQRRPATARHQVDRRAGGLDLPPFEAGEEVGHRCLHFSHIIPADPCVWGNAFMRQTLFRKGDDRRGLIGAKLEALWRNSTVIQSGKVIGYKY